MDTKNNNSPHTASADRLLRWAAVVFLVTLMAGILIILYFYVYFAYGPSDALDRWGQTGDFLGGSLNPLIGFATIFLLFISLIVQRKELSETSEALKLSNKQTSLQVFEQSFFSLLANCRALLQAIEQDLPPRGWVHGDPKHTKNYKGRAFFKEIYDRHMGADAGNRAYATGSIELSYSALTLKISGFSFLARDYQHHFGPYTQTLHQLFQWIDDHQELTPEEQWKYAALVRAQLSWSELIILFYNGFLSDGVKFVYYCEKYALFENIKNGLDVLIDLSALGYFKNHPHSPLPYTERSFYSEAARKAFKDLAENPSDVRPTPKPYRKSLSENNYDLESQWN